jgi:hypothetical protein
LCREGAIGEEGASVHLVAGDDLPGPIQHAELQVREEVVEAHRITVVQLHADDSLLGIEHQAVEDVIGLTLHAHAGDEMTETFGQHGLHPHHQQGGGAKRQREAQREAQGQAGGSARSSRGGLAGRTGHHRLNRRAHLAAQTRWRRAPAKNPRP